VTFIANHDTDSTQNHWPFPKDHVGAGYAYILTHPGLPCIFWDHLFTWGAELNKQINTLVQVRLVQVLPTSRECCTAASLSHSCRQVTYCVNPPLKHALQQHTPPP
jgi:hypothetical protein